MSTFDLLHKKVQGYIYKQKWENFRPIQDEAIVKIIEKHGNILICAPTASGKTEAAFLPIVSTIADDYSSSFRAVYISPLKALINDQFKRIDLLCKDIGVPVTKWHGDVNQHIKLKSINNPSGILLITPESLEATLLNKPATARAAFSKLQYVVIDEIHSFVGTERGAQLRSLLARIEANLKNKPIVIALSATVGNPAEVAKWFSNDTPSYVIEDKDWNDSNGVEGLIRGFTSKVPQKENESVESLLSPGFIESIYLNFLNGKNLIFGNSKKRLEEIAYMVSKLAQDRNSASQFLIHHGSLAKEIRENAEEEIKESNQSTSVFCSSTLEMGIDIGAIEKIGIIDPPWSVSGFAQRIGRSGRRAGSTKKFEFFISQMEINSDSNIGESIREDLVKSIAIVLLYLDEFIEPLRTDKSHLSTMAHQILSYSTQLTGATLPEIKTTIWEKGFYKVIHEDEFEKLLSHLVEVGFLFKDSAGKYSAGKIGEKLIEHHEYYSVFLTSDQWSVVNDGQLIGQIPVVGIYREGDHILLGGRVWLVRDVADTVKRLIVVPAKNAKAPIFNAAFGITHKAIHEKMRQIYESDEEYSFLNPEGIRLLDEGRSSFRILVTSTQPDSVRIPIFEGTVIQNTISCLLDFIKIEHGISEVCLEIKNPTEGWITQVNEAISRFQDATELAAQMPRSKKQIEKYDRFLPIDLLDCSYASTYLDLKGAKSWLQILNSKLQKN